MFAIAVTDNDWFENIRAGGHASVNFWTPTPWAVRRLTPGDRWYFLRKSPIRLIGGYGAFVRYREMTAADAWAAYEELNGMHRLGDLVEKIENIASKRAAGFRPNGNPIIGCVELNQVVALDDAAHVDMAAVSHEFPPNVVKFKYFTGTDELAALI